MLQQSKFLAIMIIEILFKDGPNQPESLIKPKDRRKTHTPWPHMRHVYGSSIFLKIMTGNTQFPTPFPFSDI